MARSRPPRLVQWSARLYRPLLRCLPASFRAAYGLQMEQVFRDLCRATYQEAGGGALVGLWVTSLWELGVNAMAEHWRTGNEPAPAAVHHGVRVGLGLGAVLAGCSACLNLLVLGPAVANLLLGCFYVAPIVLLTLAGARGAQADGRVSSGLGAGVVAGLTAVLVLDVTVLLSATAFLDVLRQHPAEVSLFIRSGAPDFAAYELEDALGGCFYMLLFGLPLGAALGALGGLVGKTRGGRLARS